MGECVNPTCHLDLSDGSPQERIRMRKTKQPRRINRRGVSRLGGDNKLRVDDIMI